MFTLGIIAIALVKVICYMNFCFCQESMRNDPNSFSYSSSSVMTYSNDGNGEPSYYHATSSERKGPGGVCALIYLQHQVVS